MFDIVDYSAIERIRLRQESLPRELFWLVGHPESPSSVQSCGARHHLSECFKADLTFAESVTYVRSAESKGIQTAFAISGNRSQASDGLSLREGPSTPAMKRVIASLLFVFSVTAESG